MHVRNSERQRALSLRSASLELASTAMKSRSRSAFLHYLDLLLARRKSRTSSFHSLRLISWIESPLPSCVERETPTNAQPAVRWPRDRGRAVASVNPHSSYRGVNVEEHVVSVAKLGEHALNLLDLVRHLEVQERARGRRLAVVVLEYKLGEACHERYEHFTSLHFTHFTSCE